MRTARRRGTRRNIQQPMDVNPTDGPVGDIHGDERNILILFFLYLLQGIPLGLSSAIPMYLQNRGVSYREQAGFSFAHWPFSLKLLWAPIVDSVFISKFGRRKSWLIPSQYLIGIFMLFLSRNVNKWLGICEDCDAPDIGTLTGYFFVLNFLAATQDIAVDGWALTMLRRCNVGYASTCNSVGQTAGYFLGYVVFMTLESAEFCNNYLRSTPQSTGLITLSGFLFFWGIVFIITTSFIAFMKHEQDAAPLEPQIGVTGTYALLWKIVKLPAVQTTIIVLLTSKIGYSACDAVATLKMVESGMPKETLARLSLPLVPLQIILPFLVSKYLVGPHPMMLYLKAVPFRLCFSISIAVLVWMAPTHIHNGVLDIFYVSVVLIAYLLIQITVNVMFVSVMAFFAQISDPAVGGTYMTLLNTVNNLGGNWPSTLALWMVDSLTFQFCWEGNKRYICLSPECARNAEGFTLVDGYYVESFLCFVIGVGWLRWARKKIQDLQNRRQTEWQVVRGRRESFIQATVSIENYQTTDEPRCMQMGYLCDRKCKTQYICVSTGSHSFNKIKAADCTIANQTCDAINGGCRANDGVTCNAQREKFTCLSPGIFPDPYDCTKYHICNCSEAQTHCDTTLNTDHDCPKSTAYNPSNNQCTMKLSDDSCIHGPVPRCKSLKDNAALINNPQIYYFCVKDDIYPFVYPQLFQCPKNSHYNSEKLACEVIKTS